MRVSDSALELIKEFEGFRANAYPDPATGAEPITIGYGHTSAAGAPLVRMGMKITKAEATQILAKDLDKYASHVRKKVTVPLTDNQFGALVSFCYNVGPANFSKSSVLKRVNDRKFDEVPARLLLWNKANKKVMAGLTRRRKAEGVLFMSGDTETKIEQIKPRPKPKPIPKQTKPRPTGTAKKVGIIGAFLAIVYAALKYLGVIS